MESDREKMPQRAYKDRYENARFPDFCAYCEFSENKQSPLNRRGHVISALIFREIRNARMMRGRETKKFHISDVFGSRMPAQDGLKFKHLCDDCENRFGAWESYCKKFIDSTYRERRIENLDVTALEFSLSVAWRVIYSNCIRSGEHSDDFRSAYSKWLVDIPVEIDNIGIPGKYDVYYFSGEAVVQYEAAIAPDAQLRWECENDYLFSVIQNFSAPNLFIGEKVGGVAHRVPGPAVLYLQLGPYHFLFAPAGYLKDSIVQFEKIIENLYCVSGIRDMKALAAIYGGKGPDDWCRMAYLERRLGVQGRDVTMDVDGPI